jgi:pimeloyl-ACP methyl ester carboxylesterase
MTSARALVQSTGSVTSKDGTPIGYRQLGRGPGVILVHGGMQASQNLMRLAGALSEQFTVYVMDRRGRGLSGPHGASYGLERECDDVRALQAETGARGLFGLSSGAVVTLFVALTLPGDCKVALYEPPLPLSRPLTDWVARFDAEIARGDLASAMVTVMKANGDSFFDRLPRWLIVPLLRRAIAAEKANGDQVPLRALIPTMHYDAILVNAVMGRLQDVRALRPALLLLGGKRSKAYLRAGLDALGHLVAHSERVELPGVGHLAADNGGKPELVARELRRFFGGAERSADNPI